MTLFQVVTDHFCIYSLCQKNIQFYSLQAKTTAGVV